MIYCVDSNIIVWGIKRQATAGQEEMIVRAEQIFSRADEQEDFILIPTIVLAEILAPEPSTIRTRYVEILSKSFIIAPFDVRAAQVYAEILYGRLDKVKEIAAATGTPRQKMKVDHMIVSIALVNGANCIYSTDSGLKAFAAGLIDVRDVPPIRPAIHVNTVQQKLFETLDSKATNEEES